MGSTYYKDLSSMKGSRLPGLDSLYQGPSRSCVRILGVSRCVAFCNLKDLRQMVTNIFFQSL